MNLEVALATALLSSANLSTLPPPKPIVEGGNPALWDTIATVDCQVKNTGNFSAAEVVQLYVGIAGQSVRQLRGFSKKVMNPEQTESFHFSLTRRDLSIWGVLEQNWILQRGQYDIFVGASVLDIKLQKTLIIL